jgi:hypothetical protein
MKMTDRKKIIYIFALFLLIILFGLSLAGRGHLYRIELFKSGQGWGYDILKNGNVYIHQPYIPAVEGQRSFRNKRSAKKTARLVIKKIRNHNLPSVTKEEIQYLIEE